MYRDPLALSALHARSMEQKEEGAQARLMPKKRCPVAQRAARNVGGSKRRGWRARERANKKKTVLATRRISRVVTYRST